MCVYVRFIKGINSLNRRFPDQPPRDGVGAWCGSCPEMFLFTKSKGFFCDHERVRGWAGRRALAGPEAKSRPSSLGTRRTWTARWPTVENSFLKRNRVKNVEIRSQGGGGVDFWVKKYTAEGEKIKENDSAGKL